VLRRHSSFPTLAITGHRALDRYPRAQAIIRQALRGLVGQYPGALWLAGGAVGADQVAVDELLKLDQHVQLVLPFQPAVMSLFWSASEYYTLVTQLRRVDSFEVVRQTYHVDGYRLRNCRMLGRADLLVAFLDPIVPFGGTITTVREAVSRGVPVYWIGL
jgi:hypothetical protein